MKSETIKQEIDGATYEIVVEHYTMSECIKLAQETIESIECCERAGYKYIDSSVYVLYTDGSEYINCQGDVEGKFKKTGAKTIIIDCEGFCYQLAGKYIINENLMVEAM